SSHLPQHTALYTLSLHDALPIYVSRRDDRLSIAIENPRDTESPRPARHGVGLDNVRQRLLAMFGGTARLDTRADDGRYRVELARSEEHTSELQSRFDLVCRLLLE